MRSVVLEAPESVRIVHTGEPAPENGQALVRLRWGGICGSDLAAYRGTSPMVSYPRVLGHELLVDVLQCPVRPELEGQRAVVEPLVPCGGCRACRLGRYNCCADLRVMGVHVDGGLRDLTAVDARRLFPVPPTLDDTLAVLAEPASIAYHAVERSEIRAGQVAVVFGAGTIGLLIAQVLMRARGCRVLVVDVDPWRLRVAQELGATPVEGSLEAQAAAVAGATGGEMADVVFEATGNAACTRATTDLVAQAGRIVLVGWNKGPVEVDTVTLMRKEVDLLGSRNSAGAFPAVLRLLEDGVVEAGKMVTHRLALDEARQALELLGRSNERALKVLLGAG
ncbi:MAG: alcohol dehydrogenase catalytic domain-containing protein [Chloroflexota bacterium]|nr:alcohol dehydrogenase catalytic domain-containing protein [Chloroflexota bacterium]